MPRPLDVFADLNLTVDGETVDVQADGKRIVVDLPSLQAGRRMLKAAPIAGGGQAQSGRARQVLEAAGLTVEVQLQGTPIAVIGAEATPNQVGRLLRLDDVELHLGPTLRQVVWQRPILSAVVLSGLFALVGWLVARSVQTD